MDGGSLTNAMVISGATVTIPGNLTVQGTQTILNTATLSVEDNTVELRRGNGLTAADGGIQVNLTTDANGAVQSFNNLSGITQHHLGEQGMSQQRDHYILKSRNRNKR